MLEPGEAATSPVTATWMTRERYVRFSRFTVGMLDNISSSWRCRRRHQVVVADLTVLPSFMLFCCLLASRICYSYLRVSHRLATDSDWLLRWPSTCLQISN